MSFLADHDPLFVRQRKEWAEILIDWESQNQYAVFDRDQRELGFVVEKAGGFLDLLKRGLFRSHRPFEIGVFETGGALLFHLSRAFFFIFSSLSVEDDHCRSLGRVERRFGLLHRNYDLHDDAGQRFARIRGPRWRIWTFPVSDERGQKEALISKRWSGGFRELFSDADTFMIDFCGGDWSEVQRIVIFAAAISIDFDFFEDNQR
jgi:uncharacterized protein YxjI